MYGTSVRCHASIQAKALIEQGDNFGLPYHLISRYQSRSRSRPLRPGDLPRHPARRPVGPNVNPPGATGRAPEPAPRIGERRIGRIPGQQCRHRHRCVVVALLAPKVNLTGVGHQFGKRRRAGHQYRKHTHAVEILQIVMEL